MKRKFKDGHYSDETKLPTEKTILLFDNEELLIFITLESFKEFEQKRIDELTNIPEEKVILEQVERAFAKNGKNSINLKKGCYKMGFETRFVFLFADALEQKLCFVFDKKKSLFVNEIKMISEGSQIGPLCGSGGRKFYVNDKLIHETMDWIS